MLPDRALRVKRPPFCGSGRAPKHEMKIPVAADIRALFDSPNLQAARDLLAATVLKYEKTAPKLAAWMEENLPEGFTIFSFPEPIRKRLRSSNLVLSPKNHFTDKTLA